MTDTDSELDGQALDGFDAQTVSSWTFIQPPNAVIPVAACPDTTSKKRTLDSVSLSINRMLITNAAIQRRRVDPNPLLVQPWDRPSFISSISNRLFSHSVNYVDMPDSHPQQITTAVEFPVRPRVPFAASLLCRQSAPISDDVLRTRALIRWRIIIESDITAFSVGIQAEQSILNGDSNYNLNEVLTDIFSRKSTATLIKRSGDLMRYNSWCKSNSIVCPWRLKEIEIYSYMQELKQSAAPSVATSFLSAIRFAQHTIGMYCTPAILSSRVCGSAAAQLQLRRTVKQAKPLTSRQVFMLEKTAVNHPDDKIRFIAGYLCFCLYSCARFKDAMYAENWCLDQPSPEFGYIESRTRKHKTANIMKIALLLPLVGFSCGLFTSSWGDAWFKMRESMATEGLDDGFTVPFVLPAVLYNNTWASRPMTTSEGSIMLREILRNEGESVEGISTHSLKATLLSWASKAQMNIEDRRLLGHHVDRNQVSPLTYSRDALAGPLERLWTIIVKIRTGQFDPEESRASRAIRAHQSSSTNAHSSSHLANPFMDQLPDNEEGLTDLPIPELSSEPVLVTDYLEDEVCSSDSGPDDDGTSVSDVSESPDAECEEAMIKSLRVVTESDESTVDPSLYIHKESGLGHVLKDEDGLQFLCGKPLTASYRRCTTAVISISMCMRRRPPIINPV